MTCPDARCKFKTPHAHRMTLHVANTGHGKGVREFRGHLSTGGGQKKGKSNDGGKNGGGGKKKGGR